MRQQAETEAKLLSLCNVSLPTLSVPAARDVAVDAPSVCLLQEHNQPILQQFVPAAVVADGNYLFRAVLLALYSHEGLYSHLRLLATIEVLLFPALYDASSRDYYKPTELTTGFCCYAMMLSFRL